MTTYGFGKNKGKREVYTKEEVDSLLNGTILYENATGTEADITLNDSVANYEHLKIYYSAEEYNQIQELPIINNKGYGTLHCVRYQEESAAIVQIMFNQVSVDGNTLRVINSGYSNMEHGKTCFTSTTVNYIKITKIIGF